MSGLAIATTNDDYSKDEYKEDNLPEPHHHHDEDYRDHSHEDEYHSYSDHHHDDRYKDDGEYRSDHYHKEGVIIVIEQEIEEKKSITKNEKNPNTVKKAATRKNLKATTNTLNQKNLP